VVFLPEAFVKKAMSAVLITYANHSKKPGSFLPGFSQINLRVD
jgi:hypothetical protein